MPLNAEDLTAIADVIRREVGPAVLSARRQRDGVPYGEDVAGALHGVRAEVTAVAVQGGITLADLRRSDEVDRAQLSGIEATLASLRAGAAVDPATLAAALDDAGIGRQVADELAARLTVKGA